jgi:hypothetical protein
MKLNDALILACQKYRIPYHVSKKTGIVNVCGGLHSSKSLERVPGTCSEA